jgi:hypothetical protein
MNTLHGKSEKLPKKDLANHQSSSDHTGEGAHIIIPSIISGFTTTRRFSAGAGSRKKKIVRGDEPPFTSSIEWHPVQELCITIFRLFPDLVLRTRADNW